MLWSQSDAPGEFWPRRHLVGKLFVGKLFGEAAISRTPWNSTRGILTGEQEVALIQAQLEVGQHAHLIVQGSCMRPWIHPGDTIEIAPIGGSPRPGLIVVVRIEARHGHELLVHRVTRTRVGGEVLTRGDLAEHSDSWTAASDIIGCVVATERADGARLSLSRRWQEVSGLAAAFPLRMSQRALRLGRRLLRGW